MQAAHRGSWPNFHLPRILALLLLTGVLLAVPAAAQPAAQGGLADSDSSVLTALKVVALRAKVNGSYVSAEDAGRSSLIANRARVGLWERFDLIQVNSTEIVLRAEVNNRYVTAENAGEAALVGNRTAIGQWETFRLVRNGDGSVSLRANANGKLVTAEGGGSYPLIANRTRIGLWEQFDLIELRSTDPPPVVAQPNPGPVDSTRATANLGTQSASQTVPSTGSSVPSTSSTTTAGTYGCTGTPNAPGGADPWGGCWPGPNNTGIAGCPPLTTYNGTLQVESGQTVENKLINGQLLISSAGAKGIKIRCVKVVYAGYFPIDTERSGLTGADQVVMDRIEVDCQGSQQTNAGLLLYGATILHGKVTNCLDGFHYQDYSLVQDSYCGDLNVNGDVNIEGHYDCAQTSGGVDMTLRHNSLSGKDTSDVAIWPDVSPVENVLVENNLLIGSPGYKIYVGKDDHPGETNKVTIRNNRFGPGGYGPCVIEGANPTWSGNAWNANGAEIAASSCK